jgi:hypothetical protein
MFHTRFLATIGGDTGGSVGCERPLIEIAADGTGNPSSVRRRKWRRYEDERLAFDRLPQSAVAPCRTSKLDVPVCNPFAIETQIRIVARENIKV